ncbi:MAG TPA: NAD(P)/FAD-dependent oxidoreductase [Acidobacteriota bacterium]|nr:NAD(P)/FAD-dependent oxidoreductase [Acidobacteriota bacterium]
MARLFRGLRNDDPKKRYDAVVVGAGVAGLVGAALLAEAGLSVLLVEQHYMVGGYCSTFRRMGYTFDAGTHFYPLLGNPGTVTGKLMKDLKVDCQWVAMDPVDHFHFPDGSSFQVPADFDLYLRRLKERFPQEAHSLDAFFAEVRRLYMYGLVQYFRWRQSPHLKHFQEETLAQALDRHFQDKRLKLLLCADSAHWGSPPTRTSYVFDCMLRLAYFLGNYYPLGGSQRFADALALRVEEMGGDILMSSRVRRIEVEEGRVTGIETVTGRQQTVHRVSTPRVLYNGDLRLLMDELLDSRWVPDRLADLVSGLRTSVPCYLTHIGLKGASRERLQAIHGYYWDVWDPETLARNGFRFKLFVPTLYDPSLCKPDRHILIVQKVIDEDYRSISAGDSPPRDSVWRQGACRQILEMRREQGNGQPAGPPGEKSGLAKGPWTRRKLDFQNWVCGQLERVWPGIHKHIEVALTATSDTSFRYTLNQKGAMLGWEMAPDQLAQERPGLRGPVDGLYFAGHWTQPGGGITPVIISAQRAVQMALEDAGRSASPRPGQSPRPRPSPQSGGEPGRG